MGVVPVLTKTTHLVGVLYVPLSLLTIEVAIGVMAWPFSLSPEGMEPPSKKVHPWSFLPVSSRYAHGIVRWFIPLLFPLFRA
jgi:hypothetical protein